MSAPREAVEAREAVVRARTAAGASARQIADELGVSERSVVRIRARTGVARVLAPPIPEETWTTAARMLCDGAGYYETARTLGISVHRLRRRLPGLGMPPGEGGRLAALTRRHASLDLSLGLRPLS